MKSFFLTIIVLATLSLTSLKSFSQDNQYKKTLKKGTIEAYEDFLKKYPSSVYSDEITELYQDKLFSGGYYSKYVHKFPNGKHVDEALSNYFDSYIRKYDLTEGILKFLKYSGKTPVLKDKSITLIKKKTDTISNFITLLQYSYLGMLPNTLNSFYADKLMSISVIENFFDTTFIDSLGRINNNLDCVIEIKGYAVTLDLTKPWMYVLPESDNDSLTIKSGSTLKLAQKENMKIEANHDLVFNPKYKTDGKHWYFYYMKEEEKDLTSITLYPKFKFLFGLSADTEINMKGRSVVVRIKTTDDGHNQPEMRAFKSIDNNLVEIKNCNIRISDKKYFLMPNNKAIKGGGFYIKDRVFYLLPGTQIIHLKGN